MLQVIAIIAILLFSIVMTAVGVYSVKRTRTMEGFLIGGRNVGAWMSAFAYGTTYFSAVIFIGYAGNLGWNVGLGSMWIGIGNAVLGSYLAWKLLAKRTRQMTHTLGVRTMPEFFEARYKSSAMKFYSAIVIFIFLVPYAASVYKGLGSLFGVIFSDISKYLFGIDSHVICMFIVALLTAIYLVLGGYVATAINDFIQGIIMITGVIVMAFAIVNHPNVGGLSSAISELRAIKPSLVNIWGGSAWSMLLINILLTSFGTFGLPQMVSKFYAIKDEKSINRATVVSTVFALIIGCGAYFVGSLGRFFVKPDANGAPVGGVDSVVPNILITALGDGLAGNILLSVILILLLSASMSTLASVVLTSSSAISVDLLPFIRKDIDRKRQMLATRLLCFLFVALSFIFATFNFAFIVSIMSFSWGVVSGCFIGPYIWGIYSKKTTKAGAWAGMVGGILVVAALTLYNMFTSPQLTEGLYAAFKVASAQSPFYGVVAMGFSLLIVPIVSLFTEKLPAEHTERTFSIKLEESY